MKLTTEYGYGIVVENSKLKQNFVPTLMTYFATETRRKDYLDFCNDKNLIPGENDSVEQYCNYAFCNYAYTMLTDLTIIYLAT